MAIFPPINKPGAPPLQINVAVTVAVTDARADVLTQILKELQKLMSAVSDLQAQVSQNTTVEGSALTLIQGLALQLTQAGSDPAAIEAVVTQLNTSASSLAAAVAANTAAAPPPPNPPVPVGA